MKIIKNICKKYSSYEEFVTEFIREAMENGYAFLIVNYRDALGVCQLLNTVTINGCSIAMPSQFVDECYEDIEKAKECNGNMIIALFNSGEMICERALDNAEAYVGKSTYYVEVSAHEVNLPSNVTVIPFYISNN